MGGVVRGGETYGDPDKPWVGLNPVLVAFAHEAEGADAAGNEELDGEDGVDLADELVADVDSRLGYRAAELKGGRQHRGAGFDGDDGGCSP
jgi:hypothetical protein